MYFFVEILIIFGYIVCVGFGWCDIYFNGMCGVINWLTEKEREREREREKKDTPSLFSAVITRWLWSVPFFISHHFEVISVVEHSVPYLSHMCQ